MYMVNDYNFFNTNFNLRYKWVAAVFRRLKVFFLFTNNNSTTTTTQLLCNENIKN